MGGLMSKEGLPILTGTKAPPHSQSPCETLPGVPGEVAQFTIEEQLLMAGQTMIDTGKCGIMDYIAKMDNSHDVIEDVHHPEESKGELRLI